LFTVNTDFEWHILNLPDVHSCHDFYLSCQSDIILQEFQWQQQLPNFLISQCMLSIVWPRRETSVQFPVNKYKEKSILEIISYWFGLTHICDCSFRILSRLFKMIRLTFLLEKIDRYETECLFPWVRSDRNIMLAINTLCISYLLTQFLTKLFKSCFLICFVWNIFCFLHPDLDLRKSVMCYVRLWICVGCPL
jgi:hypothetical protein